MPHPPCTRRPRCGGATACHACFAHGHDVTAAKLLAGGPVAPGNLELLVMTAWPLAGAPEAKVIARGMLKSQAGLTPVATVNGTSGNVEHKTTAFFAQRASGPFPAQDVAPALAMAGISIRSVTPSMLAAANLHVLHSGSTTLTVRRKTAMNATDVSSLVAALKAAGLRGARLETVYAEYPNACADVHALPRSVAFVESTRVWHASVAPPAIPGALERWRAYKAGTVHLDR